MYMYYATGTHIHSFSSMTTYVFIVWQINFPFLIYANNFEVEHMCKFIQNTNAHDVSSDNNKFLHLYAVFVPSHI